MRIRLLPLATAFMALALVSSGCGAKSTKLPVSGTITWKGKPLETGMIKFVPKGGATKTEAVAVITQGKYAVPKENGLDPGPYTIFISSPDPKSQQGPADAAPGERGGYPAVERIPAKYNTKGEVAVEVKYGDKNEFTFTIE
jgi:hypothetical protein